jgi:hypothetical protein
VACIVKVDRNRFALERFELDHSYSLVRRAIVVGALPPLVGLAIDDVSLDVDVGNACSVTDTRGL